MAPNDIDTKLSAFLNELPENMPGSYLVSILSSIILSYATTEREAQELLAVTAAALAHYYETKGDKCECPSCTERRRRALN